MKCYHHPDRDAVAYCSNCGRGLCAECSDTYEPILCENCAQEIARKNNEAVYLDIQTAKKRIKMIYIVFIVGALAVAFLAAGAFSSGSIQPNPGPVGGFFIGLCPGVFVGWGLAGIPYGWRAVNNMFSKFRFILFLPIIGWIIFYVIKFMIAEIVGMVAMPIEYTKMKRFIKANQR